MASGPGYLQNPFFPVTFAYPIKSCSSSHRSNYLVEPWKFAFSVATMPCKLVSLPKSCRVAWTIEGAYKLKEERRDG